MKSKKETFKNKEKKRENERKFFRKRERESENKFRRYVWGVIKWEWEKKKETPN